MEKKLPCIDVAYIAELAEIELTDEEKERFSRDLDQVLRYMDRLKKWDTRDVEPMCHPLPVYDALRTDTPGKSLSREEALANAPQQQQGLFLVPKVVKSAH